MEHPVVCVDFDGVLNDYKGWQGDMLYEPREGVMEFLEELSNNYSVVILTTRNNEKVWEWLRKYGLDFLVDDVTDIKIPAIAYIDDRGLKFNGNFSKTLERLHNFQTHWEKNLGL